MVTFAACAKKGSGGTLVVDVVLRDEAVADDREGAAVGTLPSEDKEEPTRSRRHEIVRDLDVADVRSGSLVGQPEIGCSTRNVVDDPDGAHDVVLGIRLDVEQRSSRSLDDVRFDRDVTRVGDGDPLSPTARNFEFDTVTFWLGWWSGPPRPMYTKSP